jgi:hypothetical protein
MCVSNMPLSVPRCAEISEEMATWHIRISHMAVGTAAATRYSVPSKRKATCGNYGNHYQDARSRGIGMESRNEMCRANREERTTGYAN